MRDAEGRRFWVVPFGRGDIRLDLDRPWYDRHPDGSHPVDGVRVVEALIDEAFGCVGARSWLEMALLDVHRELAGPDWSVWSREEKVATIKRVLERAVDSGQLVVTRQPLRMAELPPLPPSDAEDVLGPPPGPPPETTWFSVRVIDEVGEPVDDIGIAYFVAGRRRVLTTNGAGVAILAGVDAGEARVSAASAAAVREKLEARWKQPRDPNIPQGDGVTVWNVADLDGASLSLLPKKTATLVLTPNILVVRVPYTLQQSGSLPHAFTLKSRDGALSHARALSSAVRASDDGRAELHFSHVPEIHAYTLECGDGQTTYPLFEDVPYATFPEALGGPATNRAPDESTDDGVSSAAGDDSDDDPRAAAVEGAR